MNHSSTNNLIDLEYQKLDSKVQQLQTSFIDVLSTTSLIPSPQDEEYTKAFVLLFHASLEDYFEKITTLLIARYLEKYRTSTFIDVSDLTNVANANQKVKTQIETYLMIVSYATFKGAKKITEDFDVLQKSLEKYKHDAAITSDTFKSFKNTQLYVENILIQSDNLLKINFEEKNHGVALNYLVQLLTSVGIEVSTDLRLQNSLRLIAYHRGDYAHLGQNTKITRLLSKSDIEDCITDCLKMCEQVKDIASYKYN
ncbi:MAG: HEPN domain-containing protein [Saprospiraceae bacterium]|nr:HEPN domain-containing protein [Saprospiraceae bacterium]